MSSSSFRLIARMASPTILSGVMPLESLLAAAVYESTGKMRDDAMALVPVDRRKIDGCEIALASGVQVSQDCILEPVTIVRRLRREEIGPEFFAGNPRNKKDPWAVIQSKDGKEKANGSANPAGGIRALMNPYESVVCDSLSWVARGDERACAALMQSLLFIGKRRGQGFGQIKCVEIEDYDGDPWVSTSGMPLRALPMRVWKALGGAVDTLTDVVPWQHPTWDSPIELCVVPGPAERKWDPVAEECMRDANEPF